VVGRWSWTEKSEERGVHPGASKGEWANIESREDREIGAWERGGRDRGAEGPSGGERKSDAAGGNLKVILTSERVAGAERAATDRYGPLIAN